ncbi:MAG: hypothetical protein A3C13_00150 [Candidatus Lloydbacteria bacterium RIFCSPHIGHO2_02_FULL_50_11]|nr:MAG: hypothetical protein A3C13_00150 [Candidatus Lloydbacteria bacterium RIFCSPHIGHO2_02_FULL_50_11]
MQVSPPNSTASPAGTDFAVSYDKNTGIAIYEIYDGSLNITSNFTSEQKMISSSYGQPIERIEVDKNGTMTAQVAIPQDEWQALQAEVGAQTMQEKKQSSGLLGVFILVILLGGVFILHKNRKFQLILQKLKGGN